MANTFIYCEDRHPEKLIQIAILLAFSVAGLIVLIIAVSSVARQRQKSIVTQAESSNIESENVYSQIWTDSTVSFTNSPHHPTKYLRFSTWNSLRYYFPPLCPSPSSPPQFEKNWKTPKFLFIPTTRTIRIVRQCLPGIRNDEFVIRSILEKEFGVK